MPPVFYDEVFVLLSDYMDVAVPGRDCLILTGDSFKMAAAVVSGWEENRLCLVCEDDISAEDSEVRIIFYHSSEHRWSVMVGSFVREFLNSSTPEKDAADYFQGETDKKCIFIAIEAMGDVSLPQFFPGECVGLQQGRDNLLEQREEIPAALSDFEFFSSNHVDGECFFSYGERLPTAEDMQKAAVCWNALTVFAGLTDERTVEIRAFSPEGERVPSEKELRMIFSLLRQKGEVQSGTFIVFTSAGCVQVNLGEEMIWLEVSGGPLIRILEDDEAEMEFHRHGLEMKETAVRPCIAGTSPVLLAELSSSSDLMNAVPFCAREPGEYCAACFYVRTEAGIQCRIMTDDGQECRLDDRYAALLFWWLRLLRMCESETVVCSGEDFINLFAGPDGRLFAGGSKTVLKGPFTIVENEENT